MRMNTHTTHVRMRTVTLLGSLFLLLLIGLASCDIFGVSVEDRAREFIRAMNSSNRSGVRSEHISSSASNYNQIGEDGGAYWETYFPAGEAGSYGLNGVSSSGTTVTGT